MCEHKHIIGKCKKYWGIIPILLFLIVRMLARLIGSLTDSVLRSIPQMILSWFGVMAIGILVFWIGKKLLWKDKDQVSIIMRILRIILSGIYCVMVILTIGIGIFFSVFRYRPEYVVERNGIRMVASVNSFLQEKVSYYEFKNIIFRGAEEVGWEDYGNGGSDPFQQGEEPINSYFGE